MPYFDRKATDLTEVIDFYSQENRKILILKVAGESSQTLV